MYSSKLLDIIWETICKCLDTLYELKTTHSLALLIIGLIICLIAYKIYTTFYVFSDVFKEMSEIKMKKFKSFNRVSERPPNYPNGWIPVLESSHINVGETKPVFTCGYELVVFRGPSGEAHVIDAFCPHLGAHFGMGAPVTKGKCGRDCITCPFHGWVFRANDGVCTDIPNFDNKEINTINAKLNVWKCMEINDVIYVWHHSDGGEPDWEPDLIENVQNKKWVCLNRTEYILDCHIQEIEENWTDLAHFETLHTPLYYPFNKLSWLQTWLQRCASFGIRTNWTSINDPKPHNAMASIDALTFIFGHQTVPMNFRFRQVGPATLVITYDTDSMGGLSGCLVQYVNPIEPNKVRFILRNYCERRFGARLFAKVLNFFEIFMIERDMIVWNNKKFVKNAKYTKLDKPISQFRRWYSQFYADKNYNVLDW